MRGRGADCITVHAADARLTRGAQDYNDYVMRNLGRGYTRQDMNVSFVRVRTRAAPHLRVGGCTAARAGTAGAPPRPRR